MKKIISSILLCIALAGCSNSTVSPNPPEEPSNCPISTLRTGTERQGVKTVGNSFECTETGSYFMCDIGTASWLLYADHGSDTVIKLCGRPDCNHTGKDCNAYFEKASSICYYDGFLYTYNDNHSDMNSGGLIRMNLDGTGRTTVYNPSSFAEKNGYESVINVKIFNGVLILCFNKLDENGQDITDYGCYKLDGSMKEPKIDKFWGIFLQADGENFIGIVDYDKQSELFVYGIWEPEKGVVSELFKADYPHTRGYLGKEAEYYIDNGIIIENTYGEVKKELLDTGLKGQYQLVCFPDCMVAYEYLNDDEIQHEVTLDEITMYFYDWDYKKLGSVKIDYNINKFVLGTGIICGETPERIILTDNFYFTPRYYINKSDFGTGSIKIYAFNLPDFGEVQGF